MRTPWDVARRGPVVAVLTGGAADERVLARAAELASSRGDGVLTRLQPHGSRSAPVSLPDGLRVREVRRPGTAAAAAAAQAAEDAAAWIVAPGTLARPLFRAAPCPLLLLPSEPAAPAGGPALVPVDFSPGCAAAALFARELGVEVELTHAFRVSVGWHKLGCRYAEFAERLAARCRKDMDALLALLPFAPRGEVVLGGDYARTLLAEARRKNASQIVLAARRRTRLASLVPSVAETLAALAPVPVWVLRDARAADFLDVIG